MALRRYELYFRVLPISTTSKRSERVRDIDNTRNIIRISKQPCNVLAVYYIDIDEMNKTK